jgi:hypothetical protein
VFDKLSVLNYRVANPHWLNADPDPAFFLIANPDPGSGSRIRIPDPDPLDPGFDDLKLKQKITAKNLIFIFWTKIAIYLSLGLHKGRQNYRRSLQPSKENIQHLKTQKFCFFLFLGVIFALLDPDPQSECGSGSSNSNYCWSLRIRIHNPVKLSARYRTPHWSGSGTLLNCQPETAYSALVSVWRRWWYER